MSTVRVPAGVPSGGQFAASARHEADLRLVTSTPPVTPVWSDLAEQWPNEFQRLDVFAERTYDFANHPDVDPRAQVAAARDLVEKTYTLNGRFVSLPEDDGEAASLVYDAIDDDAKVAAAIERVGTLADHEARSYGARLAGALHDIEALDREERLLARAAANDPYRGLRPVADVEPPADEDR